MSLFDSISNSDPQTLHRSRDVELVHGVDNDGRSGEEEEQQEEEDVEEDTAEPPARSTHWQVFPGDRTVNTERSSLLSPDMIVLYVLA